MLAWLFKIVKDTVQGPDGSFDPIRMLFAVGGTNGVVTPVIFQTWAMLKGQNWDAVAYCAAYGGMLAAIITAGGIAMRYKDTGMANAAATIAKTEDTRT